MATSYVEKLEKIKLKLEAQAQQAAQSSTSDTSLHHSVLVENLEGVASLISSNHNWLDLDSRKYAMRSVKAPSADDPVERMAWIMRTVGLLLSTVQDLLGQNQKIGQLLDAMATPVVLKNPVLPTSGRKPDLEHDQLVQSLPVSQPSGISRQQRARKNSESAGAIARDADSGGRPSTPNLQASRMDDARSSPRGLPSSPKPSIMNTVRDKMSNLDLRGAESSQRGDRLTTEHPEPKQFHKYPHITSPPVHKRSASSAGTLTSFLGKGKSDKSNDQFENSF